MPTAVTVIAPLLLAAVLVLSAVGKFRAPDRAADAFTAMGLPRWLIQPTIIRAHPWGEIALAGLLVLVPGPIGAIVAAIALLLMLTYVGLVIRALRSTAEVDCACFGSLGADRVTMATLWRNLWFTTLAGVALACALDGRAVIGRIGELESSGLWWLGSVVAVGVTAGLVFGTGVHSRIEPGPESPKPEGVVGGEDDYVRSRTPALPLLLGDASTVNLRTLSAQKAQLLIFVSELCPSCIRIIDAVPGWQRQVPQLDVRLVLKVSPELSGLTSKEEPRTLHDVDGLLRDSFGTGRTPSAILLGTDGLLAGGPVLGADAVWAFVADIVEELASGLLRK